MIGLMRRALESLLDSPRATALASALSLAIGLFFVFVWAPHPWGWQGIDQYNDLARAVARGEPFATTDVPWGYTYYVAAFYALFGERHWMPVVFQVGLNALVPLMLYRLVRPAAGQRIAALSALLVGVFSFNTVYASTQASDAICTVLFLASVLCFVRAHTTGSLAAFAASGFLSGVVPQFRPNMILLPLLVIAGYVVCFRRPRRLLSAAVFIGMMGLVLAPWIVRNYRFMGTMLPTSTHGGVQLWYGTLQTGPYLESRAHNPRSIFASAPFDYTSLDAPIMVRAEIACPANGQRIELVYRTDRLPQLNRVVPVRASATGLTFEVPPQLLPTVVYYFFESGGVTTPVEGSRGPLVYFVTNDHLGDMDRHGDVLDVFDLGRLMRHLAWQEALPFSDRLDLDANGRIDEGDLAAMVSIQLPEATRHGGRHPYTGLDVTPERAVLRLADGSELSMPAVFAGRQTDLSVSGNFAGALVSRWISFAALRQAPAGPCPVVDAIKVNEVFYRREPHDMQRYTALAVDNISRDPLAFAAASAYRMVRLFIIRGTDDGATAHQFRSSGLVYTAGLVLSVSYFAVFLAGVVIAWRRRSALLYLLVPIVYVPLTICFVLTNMRYTITTQPMMFVFVAVAIATLLRLDPAGPGGGRASTGARG